VTTPTPEQAARHAERIVEAARTMLADPDNMEKRRNYMQRVFNIDWAAAAIVALADGPTTLRLATGNHAPASGDRALEDHPPPSLEKPNPTTPEAR